MTDAIDRAFENALVRSMGGEDPIESAKLVHVSSLAFTQQETVRVAIEAQEDRWESRQQRLADAGVSPTDQQWKDAAVVHNLLIASYTQQLKLLQKVGNPRGL